MCIRCKTHPRPKELKCSRPEPPVSAHREEALLDFASESAMQCNRRRVPRSSSDVALNEASVLEYTSGSEYYRSRIQHLADAVVGLTGVEFDRSHDFLYRSLHHNIGDLHDTVAYCRGA